MWNPTVTLQKRELCLDESKSHIIKYSWLWECVDFKRMSARKPSIEKKYNTVLTFVNEAGLSECWNSEFYIDGPNNTNYKKLYFVFGRNEFHRPVDVKPIIQLSILDRKMEKIKTVSCEESENAVGVYNFTDEYLSPPIELHTILDPTRDILVNTKLSVLIEFDVPVKDTRTLTQLPSDVIRSGEDRLLGTLQNNLSKYLDNDRLSDVVLEVKGVEIKAHKLLLSAQSPVFATMFEQTGMTEVMENRVKIDDIEPDVAKQMLEFIYTDKAPSKIVHFAEQLIAAAHKYQIKRLISKCEGILIDKISTENAVENFIFADTYELERLKESVLEFIKRNRTLLETKVFQDFERDHLKLACEIYREMLSINRKTDLRPDQEN